MRSSRVTKIPIEVENGMGDLIFGDLRLTTSGSAKPLVIICHSFMAFKDWGFFPFLGEKIAEAGFATFTFNYSLDGAGKNERITDFEMFQRNTFSRELEDLNDVVTAFRSGKVEFENVSRDKIFLLGHSRGGATAILHTAEDDRIRGIVTLSAVSTFDRWTPHQKSEWRNRGYLPLAKDSSTSPLRLGLELLSDVETNRKKLDLADAASKIHSPWLLIHGAADVTVPPKEAEYLYTHSNKSSTEFMLLEKTGHLYNAATPNEDNYRSLNYIIDLVTAWLHRNI